MKQFYLSLVLLAFVNICNSQPPWFYTTTGNQHHILVPNSTISYGNSSMQNGDCVGVFYDSLGVEACAGFITYGGASFSIFANGDDISTPEKEGFTQFEPMVFKVWRAVDQAIFTATATYSTTFLFPDTSLFKANGISNVILFDVDVVDYQIIGLPAGWSLWSTYINPTEPNIDSVCSPIVSDVMICKNGYGLIYWPPFGLNTIGDIVIGEGYQIKMSSPQNFAVEGIVVDPAITQVQLPQGWSLMGYLLQYPEALTTVMAPIDSSIIIMKNTFGMAYWPQWGLNLIGDMVPGQGYQIKIDSAQSFSFLGNTNPPTVLTGPPNNVNETFAACGGIVIDPGSSPIIVSGLCWSTLPNPTIANFHTTLGTASGVFTNTMTGLMPATTYYVRAYATNSVGTAYGADTSFTTNANHICGGIVTDIDGNGYTAIPIGTQCWMGQNLKTTHYADGTPIVNGTDSIALGTTPLYFDRDSIQLTNVYGRLYNWHAAVNNNPSSNAVPSGIQGPCPWGWHVPSDEEWKILEGEVDGWYTYPNSHWDQWGVRGTMVGDNLKSTSGWLTNPNTLIGNGSNAFGFKAEAGGFRMCSTPPVNISLGYSADFWTSTAGTAVDGIKRELSYFSTGIVRDVNQFNHGFSIRCLKD